LRAGCHFYLAPTQNCRSTHRNVTGVTLGAPGIAHLLCRLLPLDPVHHHVDFATARRTAKG
jgi:hypothetical protein